MTSHNLAKILPSAYLREAARQERVSRPHDEELLRLEQAVDRFSSQESGSINDLERSAELTHRRSSRSASQLSILGLCLSAMTLGVVAGGLQFPAQIALASLPLAGGAAIALNKGQSKIRESEQAELALLAVERFQSKAAELPEARLYLQAYSELDPDFGSIEGHYRFGGRTGPQPLPG